MRYFRPEQTIILFDWDDTLCPSNWIREAPIVGMLSQSFWVKSQQGVFVKSIISRWVVFLFRLAGVSYSFGLSSAFLRKLVRFVWWLQNRPALSFFKPCPPEEKCPLTNCLRLLKSSICEPCEMLLGFPGTSNPCVSCKNMWRFATLLILILATFRNAAIHCVKSG